MDNHEIRKELGKIIGDNNIIKIVISNPKDREYKYRKIHVKRIELKGDKQYQFTCYTEKQAFQSNVTGALLIGKLLEYFPEHFVQMNIFTEDREIALKFTRKGKLLTNSKKVDLKHSDEAIHNSATHNRTKKYILKEGMTIPPLVDMGIFTKEGKVVNKMYDKYKQINRFVELVHDVLKDYNKEEIRIIDFGCGKSYLTFVLYYYLTELLGKKVNITGLDLKEEVIQKCNETARRYGYDGLNFELGNINGYQNDKPVDMVVTLHACDTATDYALYNAVSWNATYILSVPCCQHEMNRYIESDVLAPLMKYGIIKERTAALMTDGIRGCMLEYRGYKTQLLEFVDIAHSPKNILIRAVKSNVSREKRERSINEAKNLCELVHYTPEIVGLLSNEKGEE
ncbi:MAG: class I SAM-dependent methyltransferase [Wujia sp.]